MPVRDPVHIASEGARRELRRTGHAARCGAPLSDVPFYWDCPINEDLRAETCPACITNYQQEKANAPKRAFRRPQLPS
jgi:hypothetical protein